MYGNVWPYIILYGIGVASVKIIVISDQNTSSAPYEEARTEMLIAVIIHRFLHSTLNLTVDVPNRTFWTPKTDATWNFDELQKKKILSKSIKNLYSKSCFS